jgi:hypothetical protein
MLMLDRKYDAPLLRTQSLEFKVLNLSLAVSPGRQTTSLQLLTSQNLKASLGVTRKVTSFHFLLVFILIKLVIFC